MHLSVAVATVDPPAFVEELQHHHLLGRVALHCQWWVVLWAAATLGSVHYRASATLGPSPAGTSIFLPLLLLSPPATNIFQ